MNETWRMILVLTGISALSAFLLAATDRATKQPIAQALKAEKMDAVKLVLPAYDNQPDTDAVRVRDGGEEWTFYVARDKGRFVGCAVVTRSEAGYSGRIEILVGLLPDGAVNGLRALRQNETPGLGAKIANPAEPFLKQFAGRSAGSSTWAVVKDGGDFDAITGATITSRAVVEAVQKGLKVYQAHREDIARTGR